VVKNYTGDGLNSGLAAEMAHTQGVSVEMVVVDDHVALRGTRLATAARGLAGTVFIHKLVGAAASKSLADVAAIGKALRMHDPVPQTGGWLRSRVQGYFNYYAVPGNLDSMGIFRERVFCYWGKRSSVVGKNTGTPGSVVSNRLHNGFPNLVCSIPGPSTASSPLIQDRSRMR
jgi:hypothetical protein